MPAVVGLMVPALSTVIESKTKGELPIERIPPVRTVREEPLAGDVEV